MLINLSFFVGNLLNSTLYFVPNFKYDLFKSNIYFSCASVVFP